MTPPAKSMSPHFKPNNSLCRKPVNAASRTKVRSRRPRPFQQRSDFYRCKQRGRGFSLGALPNKVDRVAVKQLIPAGVIEENRHQVSDLCAAALGQRQTMKPRLDFHGSDLEKLMFSPMRNNPSLQIGMIGPFSPITAPCIVPRQFALLEMIAELSDGH